jgi:organic hydroperoxide reductase OsmC/OhrA
VTNIVAAVRWHRNGAAFADNRYSRRHEWEFDGGLTVHASSSPHIVPVPMSDASAVDPEEAFVASLSSCHMLWFLSIARKRGFVVDAYRDDAVAEMGRNADGKVAMTMVTLRPVVTWVGDVLPSASDVEEMHHEAHEECFIANSVKTTVCIVM